MCKTKCNQSRIRGDEGRGKKNSALLFSPILKPSLMMTTSTAYGTAVILEALSTRAISWPSKFMERSKSAES